MNLWGQQVCGPFFCGVGVARDLFLSHPPLALSRFFLRGRCSLKKTERGANNSSLFRPLGAVVVVARPFNVPPCRCAAFPLALSRFLRRAAMHPCKNRSAAPTMPRFIRRWRRFGVVAPPGEINRQQLFLGGLAGFAHLSPPRHPTTRSVVAGPAVQTVRRPSGQVLRTRSKTRLKRHGFHKRYLAVKNAAGTPRFPQKVGRGQTSSPNQNLRDSQGLRLPRHGRSGFHQVTARTKTPVKLPFGGSTGVLSFQSGLWPGVIPHAFFRG